MQLIIFTLLILQGCLQKGNKHEIASNESGTYYLNLYANDFTTERQKEGYINVGM